MKNSLIATICLLILSNAFSATIPENEVVTAPKDRVDNFEDEIMYTFVRFQSFFDRMNFQLRTIRLEHVDLVTSIYERMMRMFGSELDIIRRASAELDRVIEQRTNDLGGPNDCLRNVINERNRLSETVSRDIRTCSVRANRTMESQLRDVFYPIFNEVQGTALTIELVVMEALSRGNVMVEEDEILKYLQDQYEFFTNLWPATIDQLLNWDQTRFRVESEFLIEQTVLCISPPTTTYITRAAMLEHQAEMC